MVSGYWINQDGLSLQYGTSKAVPEVGGDYMVYGDTREIETYVALVPYQLTTGGLQIPAAPTSFSGATNAAAAGITSLTTQVPLQTTAPVVTTTGGALVLSAPQVFYESIEIETLVAAAGGTSISIGLAQINPATQAFVQITPNAGVQLVNTFVTASMATAGQKSIFYLPGNTTDSVPASIAGGGTWLGNVPLVTNAITPLPNAAFISTIAAGTFTNGLLKVRLRYTIYGNINQ